MKHVLPWGALATLCFASGAYAHPEDTVRPWLEASVTHDSNYFRVANDAQALALLGSSDPSVTTYRSGAGVDADLKLGRQTLALRSGFYALNFDRNFLLPTTEWRVQADWNWVLGNRLNGNLNYQVQESIQSQVDASSAEQNRQTSSSVGFLASYQVHPSFYLDFGSSEARYAYAPATRNVLDRSERINSIAWRMPTSSGNYLGMQYRKTRGDYPNQVPARPFEQTDINLNGNWAPTGVSRLSWAVGQSRRIDGPTESRQPTWGLTGNWAATGKVNLNASWSQSVGSSDTATLSTTTVNDNAALGATWLASAKLSLNAGLRSQKQQYGDGGRTDQTEGGGVSLGYQVMRGTQITLSFDKEQRDSTVDSANYRANKWSAALRAAF